jgi:RNA polymerase sigma-70 factor, ECF subfamily
MAVGWTFTHRMSSAMKHVTDDEAAGPVTDAEALFRQHARFVAAFLRHMGMLGPEVDDAVQDVFVVAHRRGGYQPLGASPRTWLASIAVRVARARRRASSRQAATSDRTEQLAVERHGPAEVLDAKRSVSRVIVALQSMPEEHRATFVLYELEGESCESIAAIWGVPLGTVYSRLHYARKRFMEAYTGAAVRGGR